MAKTETRFVKIHRIPGGHSYWREITIGSDAIAHEAMLVADGSMRGVDPTSGDDGRLAVDCERIRESGITLGFSCDTGGHLWAPVPLIGGTSAGADPAEAAWLAGYFGVPLRLRVGEQVFLLEKEEKA